MAKRFYICLLSCLRSSRDGHDSINYNAPTLYTPARAKRRNEQYTNIINFNNFHIYSEIFKLPNYSRLNAMPEQYKNSIDFNTWCIPWWCERYFIFIIRCLFHSVHTMILCCFHSRNMALTLGNYMPLFVDGCWKEKTTTLCSDRAQMKQKSNPRLRLESDKPSKMSKLSYECVRFEWNALMLRMFQCIMLHIRFRSVSQPFVSVRVYVNCISRRQGCFNTLNCNLICLSGWCDSVHVHTQEITWFIFLCYTFYVQTGIYASRLIPSSLLTSHAWPDSQTWRCYMISSECASWGIFANKHDDARLNQKGTARIFAFLS